MSDSTHKRAIFILAGAVFATMLGNGMVMPFIPVYVGQFGLGGLGAGLLFSVHAATRTVLLPFIGRASDRWGRRGFLLVGVLFYALASLAYPLADRVAAFVGIMAVHGTGTAIVHLVSMAYIGDLAPRGEEGRYSGYMNTALLGGIAGGPVLGGVIRDLSSMSVNFLTMSILSGVSFFLLAVLLPPVESIQTGPKKPKQASTTPWQLLSCRPVVGVASFRLAYACTNALIWIFLPVLAARLWTLSTTQIGVLISVNVMVSTVLQAPCGRLADRKRKAVLIGLGGVGSALALAAIPFATMFWQVLALNVCIGACYGLAFPAHTAVGMENAGSYGMATVMSLLMMSHGVGMMVGPLLFGAIADQLSLAWAFWAGGLINLGLMSACWLLLVGTPTELEGEPLRPVNTDPVEAE